MNSVQLSPVRGQSATDCGNYDIGHYKFMSRHSGVIIIDFEEVSEQALLAIFFWYTFWFGNSVGVIYSRSEELTQVVFWLKLFPVHTLTESHPILPDYIVTVILWGFISHMLLIIFGRVRLFLQQHTVSVAPICPKLALGHLSRNFTDDCP